MFHITQSKARTAGKLAREADCMAAVQDCDGVVRLRGLFEDGSSAYMVMDHCTGGDLEELVQVRSCGSLLCKVVLDRHNTCA